MARPVLLLVAVLGALGTAADESGLRINEITVKGTHNSYHIQPAARTIPPWSYTRESLTEQLGLGGVRAIELDVHVDSASSASVTWPVYHVAVYDQSSTCADLRSCLREARAWSAAHADHVTLFVMLELKVPSGSRLSERLLDALDDAVRESWDHDDNDTLVTPAAVRGNATSLRAAVTGGASWPRVADARGKALFFVLDPSRSYHRSNATRLMFPLYDSDEALLPGNDNAAVVLHDDPTRPADHARIAGLVDAGFLVRTHADLGYFAKGQNLSQSVDELYGVIDGPSPDGCVDTADAARVFAAFDRPLPYDGLKAAVGFCRANISCVQRGDFGCIYALVMLSTRIDLFGVENLTAAVARRHAAFTSGAQVVSTNWPMRASPDGYSVDIGAEYVRRGTDVYPLPSSSSVPEPSSSSHVTVVPVPQTSPAARPALAQPPLAVAAAAVAAALALW
eukprot:m51a1_g661 hypothetical protein (453) ;mRNA; r:231872-233304